MGKDDQEEYSVEKVLQKRTRNGKVRIIERNKKHNFSIICFIG